ncbi:TIGR04100 family radical SAM protein [Hathewaya limosa]|uniref:Radical SAM enzyme (TIGR04100 family) n=1 Tax=Hathewaya limosa TaxID=1536 RepID=A0ABU0JNV9_HATLI|nr:TIGR04100 family radical SAM protein [Hathewaya limosa]MDQ0478773.1 radical SAM enzyme (TIGR04100 family) [Hathewaya limosa]
MNILYTIDDILYINITNKCPCNCVFCIRQEGDSVENSGSLWLEKEPSVEEIINELKKEDLSKYSQIVFCGYGEPLMRINEVIDVCKYIKSVSTIKLRINTNGLSDLIYKKSTAPMLKNIVDCVSISLNAPSKEEYNEISKPIYGLEAFDSLLSFAKEAKENIKEVKFSVVDVITEDQIERCKEIANSMGIPLRVRKKS